MEQTKVLIYLNKYESKIPTESSGILKSALEKASDTAEQVLACLNLYDPVVVLLLSFFLGGIGVDRFYIGDIGLGIAKICLGWLTFGIWPLVDIYYCFKKCKEKNLEKILACLECM